MELLAQARVENYLLYEENQQLKQEIEIMNKNIVTMLEKDLTAMRKQVNEVIKPKSNHAKTVEELDP
jgi:predicted Holliday junction resolvase-like endonuclease